MTEVIMPKMGDGMEEGTLLEWLKKEGDAVKAGEIIGNIQTDKATLELEAPGTGVLSGILIKEGETVPVGQAIAVLLKEGEKLPGGWGGGKEDGAKEGPKAKESEATEPEAKEEKAEEKAPAKGAAKVKSDDRVKASPLAKKIAKELGVELAGISGSGPGGRIVEKDVRSASKVEKADKTTAVVSSAEDQTIQLNRLRQITAKRTTESKQQVPHFYVTVEVDVEKILALREMFEAEESGKVSINDFVVKACALALRDMPQVNSAFQGPATLLQHGGVHVGIAVALDDGLTVPVVQNADQLGLRAISAKVKDLARRAKDNKLSLDELSGSTFSISNMGMLDVDNFLAIINQPNSAILAIASVRKKVVATDDDEIEIRSRMNITCSFDHRVADGAVGAKFINVVKDYLENPTRLLA